MLALTFADSDTLAEIYGQQTLLWGHDDDRQSDDNSSQGEGKDGAEAIEDAA